MEYNQAIATPIVANKPKNVIGGITEAILSPIKPAIVVTVVNVMGRHILTIVRITISRDACCGLCEISS